MFLRRCILSAIQYCLFWFDLQLALKIDPDTEITQRFGARPGPLDEIEVNLHLVACQV